MPVPTPSEDEFAFFFECEPDVKDADVQWPYNTLSYTFQVGHDFISFTISPGYSSLSISLNQNGREMSRADLNSFSSVEIEQERGREMLVVRFGVNAESSLWLTLKPEIRLAIEA